MGSKRMRYLFDDHFRDTWFHQTWRQFFNGEMSATDQTVFLAAIFVTFAGVVIYLFTKRFFGWYIGLRDQRRTRRSHQTLYAEVASGAPIGATNEEIEDLAGAELRRRSNAAVHMPLPPLRLASRPADGTYFETLCRFADEKRNATEPLNDFEALAEGPVRFAYKVFGDPGLPHLDTFAGEMPYSSHELQRAMERIGVADYGETLRRAMLIARKRHELVQTLVAGGMSLEDARDNPYLPSYDEFGAFMKQRGGADRLLHVANRYFEGAYPWAP